MASPTRARSAARRSGDVEQGYGNTSGGRGGAATAVRGGGAEGGGSGMEPGSGASGSRSPPIIPASLPGVGSNQMGSTGVPFRPSSSSFIPSTAGPSSSSPLAPSPSLPRPSSYVAGLGASSNTLSHSLSSTSDAPLLAATRHGSGYGPELSLPPNRSSSYSVSSGLSHGNGSSNGMARPSPLGREGSGGSEGSVGSDGSVCFVSFPVVLTICLRFAILITLVNLPHSTPLFLPTCLPLTTPQLFPSSPETYKSHPASIPHLSPSPARRSCLQRAKHEHPTDPISQPTETAPADTDPPPPPCLPIKANPFFLHPKKSPDSRLATRTLLHRGNMALALRPVQERA